MSVAYRAVTWTPAKRTYDRVLLTAVVLYLGIFGVASWILRPGITVETLLIRATGTCAFVMLHVVLAIGPLARLDRRFLPLLYNRRHLGVCLFLIAALHGGLCLFQFHALGDRNPLVSLLVSNGRYDSLAQFPFQTLGASALLILFLMAATSHDFWLSQLTAPVWKSLHMAVYVAYGLLVLHVALGVLQAETHPALAVLLGCGAVGVLGLQLAAGWKERAGDVECAAQTDGWVELCRSDEIPENRARIFCVSGERVAVFRHAGGLFALSNVCQHQNGPLGEGRIVDGCVTCPWHGYQYVPETGASPPPFRERVPVFRTTVKEGRVWLDPTPILVEQAPAGGAEGDA